MGIDRINSWFERWVHPVSRVINRMASIVLFLMMLLTMTDVVLRKTLSKSILGTVEVTEFMLAIVIFFALAQTEIMNGHVKVDLIMSRFGERAQGLVDMITQLACFLMTGLITWSTLVYAQEMRLSGEVSQDLWIPVWPFIYVVALGCSILALTLLMKFFLAIMKVVKS